MTTLSYQKFLAFMNTEYIDNCHWGQHYDPETDTIIDIKSETPIKFTQLVKSSQFIFREVPTNRLFRKKKCPIKPDILETIKEEIYPDDIETNTTKPPFKICIQNQFQFQYINQINYYYVFVTSVIYISHMILVILIFTF